MCPACLIRAKLRVNSASRVGYAQTRHHRADHLCALKETTILTKFPCYLRIEKTIGLEGLFTAQKDFKAWGYFCRIVSLFLITWRTFNQYLNKNIWMPYIICNIPSRAVCHLLQQSVRHFFSTDSLQYFLDGRFSPFPDVQFATFPNQQFATFSDGE